jgi:hypothetical protein
VRRRLAFFNSTGKSTHHPIGLAHYLLADKYRRMATNMPLILEGKQIVEKSACGKVVHWMLLVLNIAVPVLFDAALIRLRYLKSILGEKPPEWLSICYNTGIEAIGIVQVISGVIMFKSVIEIRRFFINKNAANHINTSMLIRHASAFLLYIVTTLGHFTAASLWAYNPVPSQYVWVAVSGIFFNIGSFISQILLCNIFWSLGQKIDNGEEEEGETLLTI